MADGSQPFYEKLALYSACNERMYIWLYMHYGDDDNTREPIDGDITQEPIDGDSPREPHDYDKPESPMMMTTPESP